MRWRGRARDRRSCRAYSFVTARCYATLVGSDDDVRLREIADRSEARGTVDMRSFLAHRRTIERAYRARLSGLSLGCSGAAFCAVVTDEDRRRTPAMCALCRPRGPLAVGSSRLGYRSVAPNERT